MIDWIKASDNAILRRKASRRAHVRLARLRRDHSHLAQSLRKQRIVEAETSFGHRAVFIRNDELAERDAARRARAAHHLRCVAVGVARRESGLVFALARARLANRNAELGGERADLSLAAQQAVAFAKRRRREQRVGPSEAHFGRVARGALIDAASVRLRKDAVERERREAAEAEAKLRRHEAHNLLHKRVQGIVERRNALRTAAAVVGKHTTRRIDKRQSVRRVAHRKRRRVEELVRQLVKVRRFGIEADKQVFLARQLGANRL